MKRTLFASVALVSLATTVNAATLTMTIVINGAASTSITCPITSTLSVPVAAGTVICPISVAPSGWSGTLGLSGTNASAFAISTGSTQSLVVGSSPITTAGSLSVTINAAP